MVIFFSMRTNTNSKKWFTLVTLFIRQFLKFRIWFSRSPHMISRLYLIFFSHLFFHLEIRQILKFFRFWRAITSKREFMRSWFFSVKIISQTIYMQKFRVQLSTFPWMIQRVEHSAQRNYYNTHPHPLHFGTKVKILTICIF